MRPPHSPRSPARVGARAGGCRDRRRRAPATVDPWDQLGPRWPGGDADPSSSRRVTAVDWVVEVSGDTRHSRRRRRSSSREAGAGRLHLDGASLDVTGVAARAADTRGCPSTARSSCFASHAEGAVGPIAGARSRCALAADARHRRAGPRASRGISVRQGDPLVALEAMKMELPIRAPRDAVVAAIRCEEGQLVQPGNAIVELADR